MFDVENLAIFWADELRRKKARKQAERRRLARERVAGAKARAKAKLAAKRAHEKAFADLTAAVAEEAASGIVGTISADDRVMQCIAILLAQR